MKQPVRFSEKVSGRYICKFSAEEIEQVYYSRTEYKEMAQESRRIIRRLDHELPVDPQDCIRGLEQLTAQGRQRVELRRRRAHWIVITEQGRQSVGDGDETIAQLYGNFVKSSRDEALKRGLSDARACHHVPEDELCDSSSCSASINSCTCEKHAMSCSSLSSSCSCSTERYRERSTSSHSTIGTLETAILSNEGGYSLRSTLEKRAYRSSTAAYRGTHRAVPGVLLF